MRHNRGTMIVESRDSDTLKPTDVELIVALLADADLLIKEEGVEQQLEDFPLIVTVEVDGQLDGFLFASLERVGGTPSILWGLGSIRPADDSHEVLNAMTTELYRRAAISFPDEDVLVGGRFSHPAAYAEIFRHHDVAPRPGYKATGEERAWGRRLAKRFRCDRRYDQRTFMVTAPDAPEPRLHTPGTSHASSDEVLGFLAELSADQLFVACGWVLAEELEEVLTKSS